jgi:hypothetical protein
VRRWAASISRGSVGDSSSIAIFRSSSVMAVPSTRAMTFVSCAKATDDSSESAMAPTAKPCRMDFIGGHSFRFVADTHPNHGNAQEM